MATISDYFEQAQLSQAAYALNLVKGMHGDAYPGYVTKLVSGGMSTEQAKDFANKYTVADQYTDPASGFSGTVFQDTSGKIFIAIRGTEPTAITTDWPTNIADIGSDGIAIDQGIAMYNWYQRLITPVGSQAIQYIYHKEESVLGVITKPASLEPTIVTVTGSGENEGGGLDGVSDFAVTGHSLGGHLAMIMSRIAPNLVKSTLTFNAPRFDTNLALDWSTIPFSHLTLSTTALTSEGFFDLLDDAEYRDTGSSQIGNVWQTSKIINTQIEGDVVSLIGDLPGAVDRNLSNSSDQQQLFAESINEGPIDAHSMKAIDDALAVYNLFAQIDANLTLNSITGILKASSNIGEYSLETVVSSLGVLFISGFNKRTGREYNDDRDQLYQDIKDIVSKVSESPSQTIEAFCTIDTEGNYIPLSASEINTLAQSDIAYRYALANLNSFAIIGADYAKFNQDGELDLYTSSTPNGQLSDEYLQDRANFLVQLLYENIYDTGAKNLYDPINIDVYPNLPDYYYADLTTGKQSLNAVYSNLATKKDQYQQFIFGSSGNDTITGGSKDDHLYGMDGSDTLIGGKGDDILVGGKGLDTYIWNTGDGSDQIIEEREDDGKVYGIIKINHGPGLELTAAGGFMQEGTSSIWKMTAADGTVITLSQGSSWTLTMADGSTLDLGEEFQDGDFGIKLLEGQADPEETGITVHGDLKPVVYKDESDNPYYKYDSYNNIIVHDDQSAPGRNDRLFGGADNDEQFGEAGDDELQGKAGDDRLEGGSGNDLLEGGEGRDLLMGGTGSDRLLAGAGDDLLFAEETQDPAILIPEGETGAGTGTRGDLLSGDEGVDQLYGGAGNDFLAGGAGIDVLYGGAGDDNIKGDWIITWADAGWDVVRRTEETDEEIRYISEFQNVGYQEAAAADEGADIIYGGAGNDWISGNGGDDYIDAGVDNDLVYGGAGGDIIFGRGGNDHLSGDGSDIPVADQGDDYIDGGDGDDRLYGGGKNDTLYGGAGNDEMAGDDLGAPAEAQGNDFLDGGEGDDKLWGGGGADILVGGSGKDTLIGDSAKTPDEAHGNDFLDGGDGDDMLLGYGKDDTLYGGKGNDTLIGDSSDFSAELHGDDYLDGGEGADQMIGGGRDDILVGGAGNDILWGDDAEKNLAGQYHGYDYLDGGDGTDKLMGGGSNDILEGGAGNDVLWGDDSIDNLAGEFHGDDYLDGGEGNDSLYGGGGSDWLIGGSGGDKLIGGDGDDFYLFAPGDGYDLVEDGEGANRLSFGNGVALENLYVSAAHYDENTGDVSFTPDGSDLWLGYGLSDGVLVRDGASATGFTYDFADGSILNYSELLVLAAENDAAEQEFPPDYVPPYGSGPSTPGGSSGWGNGNTGWGNDGFTIPHYISGGIPIDVGDGRLRELLIRWLGEHNVQGSDCINLTMGSGYELTSLALASAVIGSGVPLTSGADPGTDPGTDPSTDPGTDPSTDPGTDPETDPETDPATDPISPDQPPSAQPNGAPVTNDIPKAPVANPFDVAQRSVPVRADPLTFDLDDDGIETVPLDPNHPILFDHEGGGVKAGTGWIKADDGFLALDRDGNGTIDSGRELFGDSTPLFDAEGNETGLAEDGFAALGQEDTNGDGVVNAQDSRWNDLRMWQDLNQDGISQANELKTMDQLGIAGVNVAKTEHSTILPGGNEIADLGTYIRADGSTGTTGTTSGLADVNLATDTFYRAFTNPIPLSEEARSLPDIQGSGVVRDLREAASLSTELADMLGEYAQAASRSQQLALLDNLLIAWGATSSQIDMATRVGEQGYAFSTNLNATQQAHLTVLEQFNGRGFYRLPWEQEKGQSGVFGMTIGVDDEGQPTVSVNMLAAQINLLDQSWQALRQSVYDGLLLQTRLKTYVEGIKFVEGENGFDLDFSGTITTFQARFTAAPAEAVRDLLDLQRILGTDMTAIGWDGYGQLRGWLAGAAANIDEPGLVPELIAALGDFGYPGFSADGAGSNGSDVVIGDAGGDVLIGLGGNDLVLGSDGDDTLSGGTGTDILYGGAGNDTYLFNLGDGADTIVETHCKTGSDTLQLGADILAGDLDIFAEGDKLVFRYTNCINRISIANWFGSLSNAAHRLDTLKFGDGMTIDLRTLRFGAYGADILTGFEVNDLLVGGAGGDSLSGGAGDDLLTGGTGNDTMAGGLGNDLYVVDSTGDTVIEAAGEGVDTVQSRVNYTLTDNVENLTLVGTGSISGTGNAMDNILVGNSGHNSLFGMDGDDNLTGGAGNDLLDGGAGSDTMLGGSGNDTYVVENVGDLVSETAGQGIDTVRSGIDYTLNENVENLTLTGLAALSGAGNELDNIIVGNAAANTLTGLAGNDTLDGGDGADIMLGGIGDDTYIVESLGDAVIEEVDEGIDTVWSSISYTLTDTVENLTLTSFDPISGTGNGLDNVIIGNGAANILIGLAGNDTLDGGGGADIMLGGTGNDVYVVDNAGDVVQENPGEGNDTVRSSISNILAAEVENLTLTGYYSINGTGNELDNSLVGNSGSNILDGGLGADSMAGGWGDDTYILDNTNDTVSESSGQGTDTVISPFDYTLGANVENLTLAGDALTGTGNALNNVIIGTAAANTLIGLAGNDTLDGGAGGDLLIGGLGDDTYVVDSLSDTTVEGVNEGFDTVQASLTWTLADNLDNLTLTGSQAIDGTGNELDNVIIGNDAANTLTGLAGNDTLDGGAGADTMLGGVGDDIYGVDNVGDEVMESTGEGIDTTRSAITYTLTDNVENLTLTGASAIDGTGNELDNVITGNSGANTLAGLAGDDLLDGGRGADTLIGGLGDDTYVVDNIGDVVVEELAEGVDQVLAGVSHTLNDNVENLTLTGSGAIDGTGNASANIIIGNSGANVLDGRAGADVMAGGAGDDIFVVDDSGDLVSEKFNEGTDTVRAGIAYTLTDNVENLELTGSLDLLGTGNDLANTLTGNSGDNILSGLAGDDTLVGNGGNDLLDGGSGADRMLGGLGDDTYVVDDVGDEVTELAGEGIDTVRSSIDYTLGDNVENLELAGTLDINATGNSLANTLTGNSGANRLDGGEGADTMVGGAGDDIYFVDDAADVVVEQMNGGIDTVITELSHTLADNVENLILTGEEDLTGSGNGLDNMLTGNVGDNLLDGGVGIDTMVGGLGDDTYIVDETGDVVIEASGEGIDSVFASADYTLSENIEHLTLTGDADLAGTGNALDNTLAGNSGVNVLTGGAGNDTYIVDNTADVVVEYAEQGTDTVLSSADYTLSDNVENLTLTGTADIDGTGNNLSNTINGNIGANRIDGGAGADTMAGGGGDDTYIVDNAGDLVTENIGEGIDLVQSSATFTLGNNIEDLTLTGPDAIDGTGNALNNTILGNSADNRLYGLTGNDTLAGGDGNDYLDGGSGADAMSGGAGDDSYVVDNAGDLVAEHSGEGNDTVNASVGHTLGDHVENLQLTGSASITGTGNTLDNVITGNTGSNGLYGLGGNDTLTGNAGNDTLDGGAGADSMSGGSGNDTYIVDDIGDMVSEAVNQGTDLAYASIDYTLTDNVENLTLTGTADLTGTGNSLNNVITGNEGSNILDGRGGNDTLYGNGSDDTLIGGDGNDSLYGGGGTERLFGDAGNDTLDGGIGADSMSGGSGNDTYIMDNVGDVIVENTGEGVDLVQSSVTATLSGNVENLTLTGSANIDGTGNELDNVIRGNSGANVLDGLAGNDTIYGNSGNDTLLGGADNDYLDGGSGADAMSGGSGDDTFIVDNSGDRVTELDGEGTDIVYASISHTLSDNVENLTLTGYGYINGTGNELANVITGNTRNNTLSGLGGDDTLIGNAGNDHLDGGSGADKLSGGSGNDTYVVDNIGDLVTEAAGQGTDLVYSTIDYTLTDNVENLTLTGIADLTGIGNNLNNVITGNEGSNRLDGLGGNDMLYGGSGMDQLFGDAGNDTLDGGTGVDILTGGSGDDTYIADRTDDIVVELAGEGVDLVQASADYTLSGNVENLTLTGTADIDGTGNDLDNVIRGNSGANVLDGLAGNDTIYGNAGNDTLSGGVGNDYLDGGAGIDTMAGGSGDDSYVVDSTGDQVIELEGEGLDTVRASVSHTLSDNVENLELTGSAAISGIGNELDNRITGNGADNALYGMAGDDILIGNAGNDTLDGGSGTDSMSGGIGNDSYVVDDVGDTVDEAFNQGIDQVYAALDYTLTDNVENLTLTGTADLTGTGNSLANVIVGNAGSNLLNGGAGADTLVGGAGDDTYLVDNSADALVELAGGGTDTVLASASYTLSENIENLYLTGIASINGTGNGGDNLIVGSSGNNSLSGLGGDDIIYGGAGDDILSGGIGIDRLFGESGNDIYVVDDAEDQIVENVDEGIDTVRAGITYVLGENLENLVLTGIAQIDGTGNETDNMLTGNDGDNILRGLAGDDTLLGNGGDDTLAGGAGNDLMAGGSGNDTYIVDDAGDEVVEAADAGNDTVLASIDYTLTDNVEKLILAGTAGINGTGNALGNTLTGNAGMNVLDGGLGGDTMIGGAGDDTYIVDDSNDMVVEAAGQGIDTVLAGVDHTLAGNVENLVLTGTAALTGTGNDLANVLTGNGADNTLFGGGGDDLLDGGLGADLMAGGSGDDTYLVDDVGDTVIENAGEGFDTVLTQVSHTLSDQIESLRLMGGANIDGTGNAQDNLIFGNSGDNVLTGGGGDDFLHGGSGDDILAGGAGNDRYIFLRGDGYDRIVDAEGDNTLYVGSGLSQFDLQADRVGNDMVVRVFGTNDTFVLADWYTQNEGGLNSMEFDDGTILDRNGIDMLTNRPPVANPDQITVYEDGGPLVLPIGQLLANDTDPNPWDVLTVSGVGSSGVDASLSLAGGEVTYDIGDGFQYLAEGEVVQDSFSYTVRDLKGATDEGVVQVEIVGVNDIPIIESNTDHVIEDEVTVARGNVLGNDYDIDVQDVLRVVEPGGFAGGFGSLTLDVDGVYTYALDNENSIVQTMGRGAQVVEHFNFTVTDGIAEVASSLEVSVSGSNDAPIVAVSLADQQLTFNKPFSWALPAGSFTDIDNGDVLDYTATLADGSSLPEWLSFDSENLTFSGWTPKQVGEIDVMVTATDRVAATGSTEGSLAVSDIFRVSVSHGNEGVGNGDEAAPSGHDDNFNDHAGTGPSDPGAQGGKNGKTFVFDIALNQTSESVLIADFETGRDSISLDREIFSALPAEGTLAANSFLASATGTAADDNDYILYNTTSGSLLYDADGNGQGVAIEFASLTNKPAIKAEDFMIVS